VKSQAHHGLHQNGRVGLLMIGSSRESVTAEDMPSELRWVLTFELFIDYGGGNIQGSHGSIHIAADQTGKIVGRPWMQTSLGVGLGPTKTRADAFSGSAAVNPRNENSNSAGFVM
jgi:hypothetical protein